MGRKESNKKTHLFAQIYWYMYDVLVRIAQWVEYLTAKVSCTLSQDMCVQILR